MSATTILSDNGVTSGSAGVKTSGGTDGTLQLQTTTAGGTATTALSIDNSQVITFTNQPTYTSGTANGVAYLNGSKVLTTGSALTFDGTSFATTSLGVDINNANALLRFYNGSGTRRGYIQVRSDAYEIWSDQSAIPIIFGQNNAEQMRLTSTGLGIGTSSPVGRLSAVSASDNTTIAVFNGASGGTARGLRIATGIIPGVSSNNEIAILDAQSDQGVPTMDFQTAGTTRVRITADGNLLVGTTSKIDGRVSILPNSGDSTGIGFSNNGLSTYYPAIFYHTTAGTYTGYISVNSTSTTYTTSSDYRLKENIQPMQNALGVVAQLNPVTYNWKADGSASQGFIAHELQAVVPECVTGEKDAVDADGNPVYQGIDTSFLVATLTAAIKELKAELDTVKAELQTLKGQA